MTFPLVGGPLVGGPLVGGPLLAGLRVVDATEGIAGGYATKLLADLGADVTKVERVGGDPLRTWSAASPDEPSGETGALFSFLNEGKAAVAVDDVGRVTELVRAADVIVRGDVLDVLPPERPEIGRASCRERVYGLV